MTTFTPAAIDDASLTEHGVRVVQCHGESTWSIEWLRDLCPCLTCRIGQTDERRYRPWDHDAPRAIGATVIDGALHVDWADGHQSVYDDAWQAAVERSLHRATDPAKPWALGHTLTRVDHTALLADPQHQIELFEAFVRDGAVIVSGSPSVPGSVIELMKALRITLLDSSLGFIFDVKLDPSGYNVAFTSEALPLHNDNAQYAHPPSGQVLAMLVNDADGGDTVLADGWSVLERLRADDPGAIDALTTVEVGFRQYSDDADAFFRSPLVRVAPDGRFTHLRFSNQLMQPIDPTHPLLDRWYDAYRKLGRLIHAPSTTIRFRLGAGDYLLVDGYRVMHARDAYTPNGPRHLQDVYFVTQDVADRLAVLRGHAVNAMQR